MSENIKKFTKMNGLGNNFVVFDSRSESIELSCSEIRTLADTIQFDQMITIENSQSDTDVFMRINNADGAEVEACGNATRCIGRLVMEENGSNHAAIETRAGILEVFSTENSKKVMVDMGVPRLSWNEIPLSLEFQDTTAIDLVLERSGEQDLGSPSVVNIGNPHAIFWVNDSESFDLNKIGPVLENHSVFPEKANISIAEITGLNTIKIRVWERGVGATKACGTAACATCVAAIRKSFPEVTARRITINLPGGPLEVEWRESDSHVLMTGDTEFEFRGILDTETFSWKLLETLTEWKN